MNKVTKAILITLMVLGGLFSFVFGLMLVGAGVSGSGCGTKCLEAVDTAKIVGIVFWGLALVLCSVPCKGSRRDNQDEVR